jgi:hemoglobin
VAKPDLDSRAHIEAFVDQFYARVLVDPQLAPIFLDAAQIDLAVHLPHIKDYWCKLLLGERGYTRHTMDIHRRLHRIRPLGSSGLPALADPVHGATVDEYYSGERANGPGGSRSPSRPTCSRVSAEKNFSPQWLALLVFGVIVLYNTISTR